MLLCNKLSCIDAPTETLKTPTRLLPYPVGSYVFVSGYMQKHPSPGASKEFSTQPVEALSKVIYPGFTYGVLWCVQTMPSGLGLEQEINRERLFCKS